MHGLGNDFAVFDGRFREILITPALARGIADRRRGIGCDQVVLLGRPNGDADARMYIYNADGSEVESCGNATRCVATILMEESGQPEVRVETAGGSLPCTKAGALIRVDMGLPRFEWPDIPLSEPRDSKSFEVPLPESECDALKDAAAVNVGNPHCVLFMEEVQLAAVHQLGPQIERHPLFPERTNVEFVQCLSPKTLRMRVWERGVGVTLACGTGACAAMVAAKRRDLCGTNVDVVLDGGTLHIDWAGGTSHVFMSGPAVLTYRGEMDLEALG